MIKKKNPASSLDCLLASNTCFSLLLLCVSGCAGKQTAELQPSVESKKFEAIPSTSKSNLPKKSKWTLEVLYAEADQNNSSLKIARQQILAAGGRLRDAANPPNPELILMDSSVASGGGGALRGRQAGVSQEVLLPGKLSKAKAVEAQNQRALELDFEQQRISVQQNIRRVVINLNANNLLEALQWESIGLVDQALESTAIQSDLERLEIEKKALLLTITALAVENSILGHELEALLGFNDYGIIQAQSLPQLVDEQINNELLAKLGAISAEELLQLRAQDKRIAQQQAAFELAKSNIYQNPSVEAGFGGNDFTGENEASLGLRIPLPLFARQQGRLQETQALIELEQEQYKSLHRETRREILDVQQRANELDTFIVEYRDNVVPWAEASFTKVAADYAQGKTTIHDYLAVLDRTVTLKTTLITYKRDLTQVQSEAQYFLDLATATEVNE